MEFLPRGKSNKRKLEEEEELVPPGLEDVVLKSYPESDESDDYSITKLDDVRKEGQLEILHRAKRVFRDYYEEQEEQGEVFRDSYEEEEQEEEEEVFRDYYEEEELEEVECEEEEVFHDYYEEEEEPEEVAVFREYYKLKKYQPPPEEEEDEVDEDGEVVLPPLLGSNIVSDYPRILPEYTTTDEGQILQSARLVLSEHDLIDDAGSTIGLDIVADCFRDEESYNSSVYHSGVVDVDAAFLKSGLAYYQKIYPGDLDFCPDWEELAKYANQLRKSEGFDLDKYKNLGCFADHLPRRLSDERLTCFDKEIGKCIKAAMKLYMHAGGAELKAQKLVKANLTQECRGCTFYITFTAQSCVDDKERHYQAQATYNEVRCRVAVDRYLTVRLMKEP